MKAVVLATLALAVPGCSQLLGLEDTRFDQRDAMVDAPSSCDGAPRCVSSTGRSVCGQLWGTGDRAGQPLRVASPTGETCASTGSTDGPCAYAVYGQAKASYLARETADRITGEIDDCGRFVVLDLDAAAADVAIAVTATDVVESTTLVLGRETTAGTDTRIDVPVVTAATATAWGSQISSANPPDVTGGYLVRYIDMAGQPIATEELRVNGGAVNAPPAQPWGVYFSGAEGFGMVDPALTATQVGGTALVVPAAGSFQLGGFRPGKTCTPITLQGVAGALIHVTLSC